MAQHAHYGSAAWTLRRQFGNQSIPAMVVVVVVVVTVWSCLSEREGLAAHCVPPTKHKDTHLCSE